MRLGYWIKTGLKNGLAIIGSAVLFSLMMLLQSEETSLPLTLRMSIGFLLAFGILMSMVMNITVYKQQLFVSLSFGSSRKEAFVGMQLFRLIPIVLIFGAAVLVMLLQGLQVGWQILACAGVALVLGAVGSGIGMVSLKFGRGFAIVCSVIIGFAFGMGGLALMAVIFAADGWQDVPSFVPWIILAVGAAAHGISMIPEYKTVYRSNVKL